MNSSFCAHQQGHLNGGNAPHPIEPRWRTPAALLLLEGRSSPRRRLAGRSQARGLPSSRCPAVRGHTWSRSAQSCQRTPSQPTRAHPTAVSSHQQVESSRFVRRIATCRNKTSVQDAKGKTPLNPMGYDISLGLLENICKDVNRLNVQQFCARPRMFFACSVPARPA